MPPTRLPDDLALRLERSLAELGAPNAGPELLFTAFGALLAAR